jgi:tetratricopeptide (TPR) repeat protein
MLTNVAATTMYSYNLDRRVIGPLVDELPASAALAAIEAELADAAAAFAERRFKEAVDAYLAAERLIYRQVNPKVPPAGGALGIKGIRDRRLFEPLLDVSVGYLNLLDVNDPVAPTRPRDPVDPALLENAERISQVGLTSRRLGADRATDAAADWRAGQDLLAVGNEAAAKFHLERARQADPELVETLDKARSTGGEDRPDRPRPLPLPFPVPRRPLAKGDIAALDLRRRAELPRVPALTVDRTLGTMLGGGVKRFAWPVGDAPPRDKIMDAVYADRVNKVDLIDIVRRPTQPSDIPIWLPHALYYVVPLGLAECYHGLGEFETAESYYLEAANYEFLNAEVEAPYVWQRLATLYLDSGNSRFREDDPQGARPIYAKVIGADDSEPAASPLYTVAGLAPAAAMARTVLANLGAVETLAVNQAIAAVIIEVRQQLQKIAGGLDFWGFFTGTVPIWTFDYLQNVAVNFTQLAIGAERDVINFWDRAGSGNLTRAQLHQNVTMSAAEVQTAQLQANASRAEAEAYAAGRELARKRVADANASVTDYTAKSHLAISYQAASAQVSGGDDGDPNRLNELADTLLGGSSIRGSRGTIAAAAQLAAAKANREYEIGALKRQAEEMALARVQADRELAAANARVAVADSAVTVARLRAQAATQLLDVFESQFFTPEVWQRMGDTMYRLYRRYLDMAIRAARLMQQAYNFETDQSLHLIRGDYSTDEVKGLLGADALMADIQTFTYDLITSTSGKPQPVRQTLSLASRYSFAFETQFRTTGVLEFETRIEDFDLVHPGAYAQRIEAIEVSFDGIVPATGITGTLSNAGVSLYRIPASAWVDRTTSGAKYRIQPEETLVLSDYAIRQDALLAPQSPRMLRVFQGAGVASAWRLEVPRGSNDLDFGALTDVRLTFYYQARFDPELREAVRAQLATRPGVHAKDLALPLRWLYPDAYFRFQDTGNLRISLATSDFPANQESPTLTAAGILLATTGGASPGGITVSVKTPTHAPVSAVTDATGAVSSDSSGPLSPLASGTAVGEYVVDITEAANPGLDRSTLANVVLLLGYAYTPRA